LVGAGEAISTSGERKVPDALREARRRPIGDPIFRELAPQ
jgi:hypothetical protein